MLLREGPFQHLHIITCYPAGIIIFVLDIFFLSLTVVYVHGVVFTSKMRILIQITSRNGNLRP